MALILGTGSGKHILTQNDPVKNILHYTNLWDKFSNVDKILQSIDEDEGSVWLLTNNKTVTLHVELGNTIHEIKTAKSGYESLITDLISDTKEVSEDNQALLNDLNDNLTKFIDEMYVYAVENSTEELPDHLENLLAAGGDPEEQGTSSLPTPKYPSSQVMGIPAIQAPNYVSPALEEDPAIGAKDMDKASRLYTPVFGTSSGSRYHIVVITNTGVKVAARYTKNTLSLRALINPHKVTDTDTEALKELGLSDNGVNSLSVHYSPCTEAQAQRTLGALLGSFKPSTLITAMPVLSVFSEHGV